MSKSLKEPINKHNAGRNKSTKAYAPFQLIYRKQFADHQEARVNEKLLKTGRGKAYLNELFRVSLPDQEASSDQAGSNVAMATKLLVRSL